LTSAIAAVMWQKAVKLQSFSIGLNADAPDAAAARKG
jgi:hypothetical protein